MKNCDESLAEQVDLAKWEWLRPHTERDSIVLVDSMLELSDVGERVASDDAESLKRWLASGLISKPTLEQISAWNGEPSKMFSMLIVSPFILIQEG